MTQAAIAGVSGRRQRRLRNYLLDSHFQLKYTSYMVGVAVLLCLLLGTLLWRTSASAISQSQHAVAEGKRTVAVGQQVLKESQKVSEVVRMNIVKDPVYQDSPALLDAFKADAKKQDDVLLAQQRQLAGEAEALERQASALGRQQRVTLWTLLAVLSTLVVAIGCAGIVVTHKVAGPIFKMKRQLRDVGEGHLKIPGKLRKGDELVDFFDTFEQMVRRLRQNQEVEIGKLDAALARLESSVDPATLEPLKQLRAEMQAALD
jgi:nitrogen fixation/metabolism regulation signal transduction histidine kinase